MVVRTAEFAVLVLLLCAGPSRAGDTLVYIGGEGGADDVYVLDPAGGEAKRITQNAQEAGRRNEMGSLAAASDGSRVAYLFEATVGAELRIAGLDGSSPVTVEQEGMESSSSPSWSPGGAQLAFLRSKMMFDEQVCLVDPGGQGVQRITSSPEHKTALSWSPDGRGIAYRGASPVKSDGGTSYNLGDLWVVDPAGGEPTRLTSGTGDVRAFAWSPDGASLVYVLSPMSPDQEGLLLAGELWVVSASGGDPTKLTPKADSYDSEPCWSPDGASIAFSSVRDGGSESVYVMRADGSEARRLTDNAWGSEQCQPKWAPSGAWLAYGQKDGWELRLCLMAPDGSGQREIAAKVKAFVWTTRE